MTYVIGIDIGTSSTKTALWREDGALLAETSAPYPLHRPHPAWAQMDANEWWAAACATVRRVLAQSGVDPRAVVGVGVDALGWALTPVDRLGRALHPAMIWLDRRAEAEAAQLRARPDADHLVDLVANPLDAAYLTPKLLWLKHHHPDIFEAAHQFLTASGFIVQRLTGAFTCDYTQAYGFHFFDIRREQWDAAAAQSLGLPPEKFPPLFQSCQIVGQITTEAAAATGLAPGTPVIAGALDAAAGAFGSGVVRVGQTADQGGTAFGLSACVDRVMVEPRLIFSHHVAPGLYLFQGGTVGGGMLGWFKDTLGQPENTAAQLLGVSPYELMSRQVAESPAGANGLIFLPYMAGERSPLWNSQARGVFFGLSYKSSRADILRAIMEGCAYAVHHNVQVMAQKGVTVQEWIGIGGASNSPVWCQIKADITNRPFTVARRADGGPGDNTLGLTAMVLHATGRCPDMAGLMESFLPNRTVHQPVAAHHALYRDLFEIYLSLSQKLQPDFARLAQVHTVP